MFNIFHCLGIFALTTLSLAIVGGLTYLISKIFVSVGEMITIVGGNEFDNESQVEILTEWNSTYKELLDIANEAIARINADNTMMWNALNKISTLDKNKYKLLVEGEKISFDLIDAIDIAKDTLGRLGNDNG